MIDPDQGKLVGFKGDMIHIFNKNEGAIHRSDYFLDLAHRENILLLGDSMGDLRMADGATNNKNLLKIGFLNDKVQVGLTAAPVPCLRIVKKSIVMLKVYVNYTVRFISIY